jgi:hypothetical protein
MATAAVALVCGGSRPSVAAIAGRSGVVARAFVGGRRALSSSSSSGEQQQQEPPQSQPQRSSASSASSTSKRRLRPASGGSGSAPLSTRAHRRADASEGEEGVDGDYGASSSSCPERQRQQQQRPPFYPPAQPQQPPRPQPQVYVAPSAVHEVGGVGVKAIGSFNPTTYRMDRPITQTNINTKNNYT